MPKTSLDAIDRKILKYLIKNARMPFLEIARECGISGAAIHQRIRKLDDSGVILGSRLIVDPKMMGFDVCAHISITLKDPQLLKQTVEQLKEIPEIVEAHFITGSGNILVKLYCVDNEHLMRTIFDGILRIQGVSSTETQISLQEAFQRQVNIDFIEEKHPAENHPLSPHDGDPIGSPFFHACEGKGATRFVIISRKNPPGPDFPDLPGTRTTKSRHPAIYPENRPPPAKRRTCRHKRKAPRLKTGGAPRQTIV